MHPFSNEGFMTVLEYLRLISQQDQSLNTLASHWSSLARLSFWLAVRVSAVWSRNNPEKTARVSVRLHILNIKLGKCCCCPKLKYPISRVCLAATSGSWICLSCHWHLMTRSTIYNFIRDVETLLGSPAISNLISRIRIIFVEKFSWPSFLSRKDWNQTDC